MLVGVSNEQSLGNCARVGVATVLAYARVTHHSIYMYRVYMVDDHVYSMLSRAVPSSRKSGGQILKNYIKHARIMLSHRIFKMFSHIMLKI